MSKNLNFLSKVSDILTHELDVNELIKELKLVLSDLSELKDINMYVYDSITNTIRDCADAWSIIDDDINHYQF